MRVLLPLLSLLAVVPYCAAEISALEASLLLYYYTSYDLDFEVEGRNRTIARACKGSGTDNKCNFNEFVNYVSTGEPSTEPKYFEVTNPFFFYPGDVGAIIDQLRILAKGDPIQFELMIKSVKTAVGMTKSLGRIADRNYKAAKEKKKDIERAKANMKVALSGMAHHAKVKAETGMLDAVKAVKNLQVKTSQRTSEFAQKASDRINWRATVEANKDLFNRNSQLFKDVATAVRGHRNLDSVMRDRTIAQRTGEVFSGCM